MSPPSNSGNVGTRPDRLWQNASPSPLAGHGYRWLDYRTFAEDIERDHIAETVAVIERTCGKRPVGWYTGRVSGNTHCLVRENGGFVYSSDAYNDDLPYWSAESGMLIVPYTLVNNDARFLLPNGFATGDAFFRFLADAFDQLWAEGETSPKMMSVGLHSRISGHPARTMAVARFLDYVMKQESVWICRREEIARHWLAEHPPNSGVGG